MKKYPYLKLSLKTLPGERWKKIPGLEGYYTVSNFGRIKRLEYEMVYSNGAVYIKPEKIIKPGIRWHLNNYKKDYTPFLVNRVALEGVRYNFTIARLVYHCFVKPFDLEDKNTVLFYKDGDHLNIRPSNLFTASLSEKQKRIKELRRSPSPLHKMTPEERRKRQLVIARKLSKQVSQYRLTGKKIKTFSSAKAAYRATGVSDCGIGAVARGKAFTAGGFIWKYGKAQEIDLKKMLKTPTIRHSPLWPSLLVADSLANKRSGKTSRM